MDVQAGWRSSLEGLGRELDVASASLANPRLFSLLGGRENDDELLLPAVYVAGVRSEQVQMCPLLGVSTPSERGAPWLEVTVPVKLSLSAEPIVACRWLLRSLLHAFAASLSSSSASSSPQLRCTPRARTAAPADLDSELLVGVTVEPFLAPQRGVCLQIAAMSESVEERFALDELILNQQKNMHSQLACRVARLEARQKEVALERQARLAALERESAMESRLYTVETLTSSPLRPSPHVALRRTTSAPKAVTSASKLARALSLSAMAQVPEDAGAEEEVASALMHWPLVNSESLDGENEEPVECDSPSVSYGERRLHSVRSRGGSSSDGSASWGSSMASPAQGTLMRIPAFLDSLPPTPCSGSVQGTFGSPAEGSYDESSPPLHREGGSCTRALKSGLRRARSTPLRGVRER